MSNLVPMPNAPTMKQRIAKHSAAPAPNIMIAAVWFCAGGVIGLVLGIVIGMAQ